MVVVNDAGRAPASKPMLDEPGSRSIVVIMAVMVTVPFLALVAAVPVAWGWGLSWLDMTLALCFYLVSGLGVTVGFHRYFTHGAFKASRWLRITLAVAGSLALEGTVVQ
jgi:stearoyl-CoA desaturase (Delta-9 desaturase)